MRKIIFISFFLTFAAYAQQQRIAIMGTEDDGDPPVKILDLAYLTDKLREVAGDILPNNGYIIMTQQSIVDRLGSEEQAVKLCREATCLADLGRKVSADYIAQARVGRFSGDLTIKVELYRVGNGALVGSFTGDSKDVRGLLSILDAKSPILFNKMPNVSEPIPPAPVAAPEPAPIAIPEPEPVAPPPAPEPAPAPALLWSEKEENEEKEEKKDARFGVRAWINVNNVSFGYNDFNDQIENGFGYGVGLMLNVPIARIIGLNAGLDLYYRELFGKDINYGNDSFGGITEFTVSIPVLLQFGNPYYFAAGIQLDVPFLRSGLYYGNGGYFANNRSPMDFGLVLGLGYVFENFGFDFKYVYGLTGLFEDFDYYDKNGGYMSYKDKSWLVQYCFGMVYLF
jgi:hypothetical protein